MSELIKQKAVNGLSIGFAIKSSDYNSKGMRVIDDVELMEISVVTFPANAMAEISQIKGAALESSQKINKIEGEINKMNNCFETMPMNHLVVNEEKLL